MRARRSGDVVNITSMGNMVSVPHLLPYTCAKFADGGELGQAGIHVTTVMPGFGLLKETLLFIHLGNFLLKPGTPSVNVRFLGLEVG